MTTDRQKKKSKSKQECTNIEKYLKHQTTDRFDFNITFWGNFCLPNLTQHFLICNKM